MSGVRSLTRRAAIVGVATASSAPIRVDSADSRVKVAKDGSGTTETILQEAASGSFTPTVAVALTAAQSGMNIFLNASAGFAITLPAVANGLRYRFTTAAAFATTPFTVITPASANILQGEAIVNAAKVACASKNTITFVETAETVGDFIEVWSDGTSWFVFGCAATTGAITFA